MTPNLSFDQILNLFQSVFNLGKNEHWLTIMVDLPDARVPDSPRWRDRRTISGEWFETLVGRLDETPFSSIVLCLYQNVGSNNNDLPESCIIADGLPEFSLLPNGRSDTIASVLAQSSVVVALTEFSATAPLKILAREHKFRGATMPGFLREMIPTLSLDYEKVNARVLEFKQRMDDAEGVRIVLTAEGKSHECFYDLRFRTGHASGGLMREPGIVGNLPSGEAYIVPYEGEQANEPSRTEGQLAVQFGDEIVVYHIERNRATKVLSQGRFSDIERSKLDDEPAYGNIAEIGIGVLGEWGVKAIGSTLLDEKLGLHIAFGRSEHFGGITSPSSFKNPKNVIHIDRVYVPSVQPLIAVSLVEFSYPASSEKIIINGKYVV
ncbi:MAG: hypothetical protein ACKVRP_01325 [Bacteroidota bacterium]